MEKKYHKKYVKDRSMEHNAIKDSPQEDYNKSDVSTHVTQYRMHNSWQWSESR